MNQSSLALLALLSLSTSPALAEICAEINVDQLSSTPKLDATPKAGATDLSVAGITIKTNGSILWSDKNFVMNASWTVEEDSQQLVTIVKAEKANDSFQELGACSPPDDQSELKFYLDLKNLGEVKVKFQETKGTACEDTNLLAPNPNTKILEHRLLKKDEAVPNATDLFIRDEDTIKGVTFDPVSICPAESKTPRQYQEPSQWCPKPDADDEVVCVKLEANSNQLEKRPKRGVIRPNTGLKVYVLHAPGANVAVSWGGTQGLVQPILRVPQPALHGPAQSKADGATLALSVSSFGFSPRRTGAAPLTITTKEPPPTSGKAADADGSVSTTYTVELEVEELSWGAVRFGFASVFGDAATPSYEIRTFAGGNQTEIALASDPVVNFDIAVGFAPYIIDLLLWGGRSHTGGDNAYVAPYIGFGLAGQSATGIEALNAIYTGIEVEFTPTFSLAGAVVWRKVTDLADGYAVGSPVGINTNYTTEKTGVGFGLILNVSPDFLQFATPSSSSSAGTSTVGSATEEK